MFFIWCGYSQERGGEGKEVGSTVECMVIKTMPKEREKNNFFSSLICFQQCPWGIIGKGCERGLHCYRWIVFFEINVIEFWKEKWCFGSAHFDSDQILKLTSWFIAEFRAFYVNFLVNTETGLGNLYNFFKSHYQILK